MNRRVIIAAAATLSVLTVVVWSRSFAITAAAQAKPAFTAPRGLRDLPIVTPSDNALTAGRIALGKQLFFDPRLSRTKKMSCETCHVPEKGWTDGLALSPRFDGSMNTRHSPTLYGAAFYPDLVLGWPREGPRDPDHGRVARSDGRRPRRDRQRARSVAALQRGLPEGIRGTADR